MFQTSETTDLLDTAMAKAQSEVENALKTKTNPAFKSKYADLTSHFEASKEALAKHELSLTQWPLHSDDNRLHLLTRIAHKGQWMQATMSLPVVKFDAQGTGSVISYAKRYALAAALGIGTEDDDGNAASGRGSNGAPPAIPPDDSSKGSGPFTRPAPPKDPIGALAKAEADRSARAFKTPTISDPQQKRLFAIATSKGFTQEGVKEIIKQFGYDSTKDITMKDYNLIIDKIEGKA